MINDLINSLTKNLTILDRTENNENIYIFFISKGEENDAPVMSGQGPLWVNKKTKEYKFLQITEFINNHYKKELFPNLKKKESPDEIISKLSRRKLISDDDIFDYIKSEGLSSDFMIIGDSYGHDKAIVSSENTKIIKTIISFFEMLNVIYSVRNDNEINFYYKKKVT